ncbi:hypothetical protein R1sor_005773 [Riccia sorocarpa]|uniref:Uncharacterized protein n=1 Tax=Riccia sorocarpa TaxID=122646 RepID=A0ABD3HNH7_9MARC
MSRSSPLLGKRRRGGDDEVFFDNYHTHKRYLTEVMASSMIGLSVGDSAVNQPPLAEVSLSPAQTETGGTGVSRSASSFPSNGDDTSTLDSPMSEDSDESVGYRLIRGTETVHYSGPASSDLASVNPATPCSARRFQRLPCHTPGHFQSVTLACRMYTSASTSPYAPSAWPRCPDSEGRLPPSPNDACQSADLRRATLLRNLQLRAQQPAQPNSPVTTPESRKSPDNADEQESVEEGGDQSSPNSGTYKFYNGYDHQVDQIGMDGDQTGMGSPSPCVFSNQVVRGSPRVRSLLLGVETVTPESAEMNTEISTSGQVGNEEISKAQPEQVTSRIGDDRSFKRSRCPRSPRSPRSPKTLVSSYAGYDVSSPKDGNVSDTESTFTRRSANRTSLSRNPSVCSRVGSSFSDVEAKRPVHAPR